MACAREGKPHVTGLQAEILYNYPSIQTQGGYELTAARESNISIQIMRGAYPSSMSVLVSRKSV